MPPVADPLAEYEALRDRLEAFDCVFCVHPADMACKCACHEAGRAFVAIDVLIAENKRLEGMAEGNAGCAERAYAARDAAQQRESEALAQVRALTRERESDYAQALAHRKGLTAKLDMAEAELERLRAAVEHLCGQICTAFRPYGRHAPECLAYELLPDESQARSAEQPGGGT